MNYRQAIPLMFTLAALLAGFYSMIASAAGNLMQAAQLIMVSMILDGLDGTIARRLHGTSDFGADLDTFVDFSSFGIAPAILAYHAALKGFGVWGIVIASAIVATGALRLARFRTTDPHRGQKGYLGLPITVNAGWIALFVIASSTGVLNEGWFSFSGGPMAAIVWGGSLALCALQISHVRYGKPTKDPIVQIVCVILTVCLFVNNPLIAGLSAIVMLGYGAIYGFITPILHHRKLGLGLDCEEDEDEEQPVSV